MPRRSKKARRKKYSRMSFKQMCRLAGISPKQRIFIVRYMKNKGVR